MNGKRGWKTKVRAAWLVAWLALIVLGFTLSTPPTPATMPSCALPETTEDAYTLQDPSVQVCAIPPLASQDSEARSGASQAGPGTRKRAPDVVPPAPAAGFTYELIQ